MGKGPIIANRHTGEIVYMPEYTQEEIDRAWEAIAKAFVKQNPDLFASQEAMEEFLRQRGYAV